MTTAPRTSLVSALADLVVPVVCAGCGRAGGLLCASCRLTLDVPPQLVHPSAEAPGLGPVCAAAGYEGPVRAMLLAHKERGVLRLAGPLGTALAVAVAMLLRALGPRASDVLLVPVPSRRSAVRQRGHDPTARLAARAAGVLGADVRAVSLLRHARPVLDQAGLGAAQRAANLAGALEVRRRRAGRAARLRAPVVVVDDLVTTGASLAESGRALRVAGFAVLGSAVVAATAGRSLAVDASLG